MKDVLKHILPLFWNYSANLFLIISNPFSVFSDRVRDPRYFRDSMIFLALSCLLSSSIAIALVSPSNVSYSEIVLQAIYYGSTALIHAVCMYVCWWIFGYRGLARSLMMPFIYANASFIFCTTFLAIFVIGALKIFDPASHIAVFDIVSACGGLAESFRAGRVVGENDSMGPIGTYVVTAYVLISLVLMLSALFGAYRTAFISHKLSNELWNTVLVFVSLFFFVVSLLLSEMVLAALSENSARCAE